MEIEKLDVLKSLTLSEVNKENLMDINDVSVNQNLTAEDRITNFLESTENPYFIRCGDYTIKFCFSDNDLKINDCIHRYLNHGLDERL